VAPIGVLHLNALAISEIGLPGLEPQGGSQPSLMRLVVDDNVDMPLSPGVREGLKIAPAHYAQIKATFRRAIRDFHQDLEARAPWYEVLTDDWLR
jgi:hypothetical protein